MISHLISSHLISSHLISSHLISSHLISLRSHNSADACSHIQANCASGHHWWLASNNRWLQDDAMQKKHKSQQGKISYWGLVCLHDQDDEMTDGAAAQAGDGSIHASEAADSAAQSDDNECEADEDDKAADADADDDDSLSGSERNSSDAEDSPSVRQGRDPKDVSPSPSNSKDEESSAANEEDEEADAASQSGAESMSEDGNADSQPEPGGTGPLSLCR